MKRTGICILLVALFSHTIYTKNTCPIIPRPVHVEQAHSVFELSRHTIIVHDEGLEDNAYYLQKEILDIGAISVPTSTSYNQFSSSIVLRFSSTRNEEGIRNTSNHFIDEESYSIRMDNNVIFIEAKNEKGIFNGIVSLLQLVRTGKKEARKITIDCYNIDDAPAYEWRGFMLDEARHFFGKEKVKELLDWMAFYKLNRFHWHLVDGPGWRIEIKQYPKLAYIGGIGNETNPYTPARYYTQEEIKEIVRYAAERHIEIIPEIEMPGHASAANRAYPEYSGGGSKRLPDFTFNPGLDSVYSFLTNILREVDVLFPSQIIHIGADEAIYGNEKWPENVHVQSLMKREGLNNLKEVEEYFVKRMTDSLIMINNKSVAWDEVADYDLSNKHTIGYYWRSRLPEQLQKFIDNDFPVVLCPNRVFYLDYRQDSTHTVGFTNYINEYSTIYNFSPSLLPVQYKEDSNILGIQGNLWTEKIETGERLDFMLFPRIAALAETAWNKTDNKNIELFNERLKEHLDFYREDGVYFYNPFDPGENKEPAK